MFHERKLFSSRSKSTSRWWHMILLIGFVGTIGAILIGCEKEKNKVADEYYVKYEVNSSTIYIGGKLDVTINTETDRTTTVTINQRKLSEIIIGPVQKGFNATLRVTANGNTHDRLKLYTNIYVSKNNSPFALKVSDGSDEPRDFVWTEYTIDY